MADIFGDRELFLEFEKDRPACDELLMQKLEGDSLTCSFYKNNDISTAGDGSNGGQRPVSDNGLLLPETKKETTTASCPVEVEHNVVHPNADYIKKLEKDNRRLVELNIL